MEQDNLKTILDTFLEASPESKRLLLDYMAPEVLEELHTALEDLQAKVDGALINTSLERLHRKHRDDPDAFADFMRFLREGME